MHKILLITIIVAIGSLLDVHIVYLLNMYGYEDIAGLAFMGIACIVGAIIGVLLVKWNINER